MQKLLSIGKTHTENKKNKKKTENRKQKTDNKKIKTSHKQRGAKDGENID